MIRGRRFIKIIQHEQKTPGGSIQAQIQKKRVEGLLFVLVVDV
jgi:hypothetical protein